MSERAKRFQSAVILFALILLIFLVTAIGLSFLPQDLSDLAGRTEDGQGDGTGRDIERVLDNAATQGIAVTLTEEEINQWLAQKVRGEQEGVLKDMVSYRGAWIRLKDGSLDLIFERVAFGQPHTVAMNVEIEQIIEGENRINSQIHWRGGRLGQMPVMQGYLHLVWSSYINLSKALKAETRSLKTLLQGRATVTIEEGTISFQPREDLSDLNF